MLFFERIARRSPSCSPVSTNALANWLTAARASHRSSLDPAARQTPRLAGRTPNSQENYANTSFPLRVDRCSCSPGSTPKRVGCLALEPANVPSHRLPPGRVLSDSSRTASGRQYGAVGLLAGVLLLGLVLSSSITSSEEHGRVFKWQAKQQTATGFILNWCRYDVLGHGVDVSQLPL